MISGDKQVELSHVLDLTAWSPGCAQAESAPSYALTRRGLHATVGCFPRREGAGETDRQRKVLSSNHDKCCPIERNHPTQHGRRLHKCRCFVGYANRSSCLSQTDSARFWIRFFVPEHF